MTRTAFAVATSVLLSAAVPSYLLAREEQAHDRTRAELEDARRDWRVERAVADVCMDVLGKCRAALDDRGFCSLWVAP